MKSSAKPRGRFVADLVRNGKVIGTFKGHNDVTTAGKNHILETQFSGGTPVTTWYIGLINDDPTPVLLAADTLASHTGWAELTPGTDYTGNRLAWVEASASAGSKGTTSATAFPMLTTKTVHGILISSVASGTSGTLWATGAFDSPIDVINGDTLNVSYVVDLNG